MENSVVVITGGTSGLGLALAELCLQQKAKVVISSANKSNCDQVAREKGFVSFAADVSKQNEMEDLARFVVATFGKIDFWINNAGIWLDKGPVESIDMTAAKRLFDVNVFGTFYGSIAAINVFKKSGGGTVVNIISTSALEPRPFSAIYSSSKHALKGFTDGIREEVRNFHIKVLGVYPGGIKTKLFGDHKPAEFDAFWEAGEVAKKILENLERPDPIEELVLQRPGQTIARTK